jgi:hypothetical protein
MNLAFHCMPYAALGHGPQEITESTKCNTAEKNGASLNNPTVLQRDSAAGAWTFRAWFPVDNPEEWIWCCTHNASCETNAMLTNCRKHNSPADSAVCSKLHCFRALSTDFSWQNPGTTSITHSEPPHYFTSVQL